MLNEELDQLLKNLHLKRVLEILEEELAHAQKNDCTYQEFLLRLLRAQWHNRQETALQWRIKRARLPECWTIEARPRHGRSIWCAAPAPASTSAPAKGSRWQSWANAWG